ncbi:MAG: outer membrane protein transport protein, partial [Mariprofundaceae bacterium]|nr:outer membrane protein transport protein [Mariprofundaceae bacterium]
VQFGANFISPTNDYTLNGTTYQAERQQFVIPHLYVNYQMDSPWAFGFSVNAPFGLTTDWSKSAAPFSLITAGGDSVTLSTIEAVASNVNAAYQLDEDLSLAVGLSYYDMRKVNLDSQAVWIEGSGDGTSMNAALLYKNEDSDAFQYQLGLSYRGQVKVNIDGTAVGGPALAGFNLTGVKSDVSTSMILPDVWSMGISFALMPDLTLAIQADRVNWATFDQIDLAFAASPLNGATGTSSQVPENWSATTTYRVGVLWQYAVNQRVLAGYVFDPTPTNDADLSPRLPGADRSLLTLGYGYDWSDKVTIDVAYAYVQLEDRNVTAANKALYHGLYAASAQLLLATWSYQY